MLLEALVRRSARVVRRNTPLFVSREEPGKCPTNQDVASKACQMPAIRYGQRPLGSHFVEQECPATVRTTSVIVLYNTSRPVGLQEMPGGVKGPSMRQMQMIA